MFNQLHVCAPIVMCINNIKEVSILHTAVILHYHDRTIRMIIKYKRFVSEPENIINSNKIILYPLEKNIRATVIFHTQRHYKM